MDDIQFKLIEENLRDDGRSPAERLIASSPLAFVATGLIIGICAEHYLKIHLEIWVTILLAASMAGFAVFFFTKKPHQPLYLAFLAMICFAALGGIRLQQFYQPVENNIQTLIGEEKTLATIRGQIITDPVQENRNKWAFGRFNHSDPGTSFYLDVTAVETSDGWQNVAGTVRVNVDEPVLDLKNGDFIETYCWLGRFSGATNPGQFDMAQYMGRKRIFLSADVKNRNSITFFGDKKLHFLTNLRIKIKKNALLGLLKNASFSDTESGLLNALLLGYRGNIDNRTYQAFRETGLLHFISLSGMHLGILTAMVWWLGRFLQLSKRWRAAVCIICLASFFMVVPPRPPTVRAGIIAFFFCASILVSRQPRGLNSLSLAAVVLLLINPGGVFEVGWQLSFASVLGILIFTEKIRRLFYRIAFLRKLQTRFSNTILNLLSVMAKRAIDLLAVGIAAWAGGAGILLFHFYLIVPLSSLWTVLVFPFVCIILTVGYLKMTVGLLIPSVGYLAGFIVQWASSALMEIVKFISELQISEILIGKVNIAVIVFYYAGLALLALGYAKKHRAIKIFLSCWLVLLIAGPGIFKWQKSHSDSLTLTCLDVSHGQTIVAEMPGGKNLLFDAGSLYRSNVGNRTVLPFCRHRGIGNIDTVFISHNDLDHINGIPEVCQFGDTDIVYANGFCLKSSDKWNTMAFLREKLAEQKIMIEKMPGKMFFGNGAVLENIWPVDDISDSDQIDDNNGSSVTVLQFGGRKILLTSDIGKSAQKEICQLYPDLKADVVIVPHHGSRKTLADGFLEHFNAEVFVTSCGYSDYLRLEKYSPAGPKNLCTAVNGAITITIDAKGNIDIKTFKK